MKHMPMVRKLCGPASEAIGAESGLGGTAPGSASARSFVRQVAEITDGSPKYAKLEPAI